MDPIIEFDDVGFDYPALPGVLREISFRIPRGRKIALVGANGAGKTTLLLMCNGTLQPSRGVVRVDGRALSYRGKALRELRKKVGMVFQNPDMQIFAPTVAQDVAFGPLNLGMGRETIDALVVRSLAAVGLSGFERRTPHQLSGGEKKRVAIAGVLAMEPDVLVFDEPTSSLDPATAEEIMDLLDELNQEGATILVSTHDVELAYRWADEVILMKQGSVLARGSPAAVFNDPILLAAARLRPPVLLDLVRELAARGVMEASLPPQGLLDLTDSLACRIGRTGLPPAPGSVLICDVGNTPPEEVRRLIGDGGAGYVGAMGTRAKQFAASEGIVPDFTYGVIDKCILKALVGKHSLILTSGGMVRHAGKRIGEYGRESGNPVPVAVIGRDGGAEEA